MTKIDERVEEVKSDILSTDLARLNYRLSDAIREGSSVSEQAIGWCSPDGKLCAMSAAIVAARARGYR